MSSHNSLRVPRAPSNWWPAQVWVINCHFAWPELLYCGHCHGHVSLSPDNVLSPSLCLGPSDYLCWVVVHKYRARKLSIILNRPATGVMTSPCFLPLVAFFQPAHFVTWEYLITDFNWHKPTQHTDLLQASLCLNGNLLIVLAAL